MRFSINELPLNQFALLSISKKELINLPPRTLNALLNGGRTSLMRFPRVQSGETEFSLDAKLSLGRDPKGNPILKIHPINQAPKNTYGLSPKEMELLDKDDAAFISKKIRTAEGEIKEALISLDKTTNEYVVVNKSNINAPEEINDIRLSEKQKEDFVNGKEIKIGEGRYKFNPNSEIGVSSINGSPEDNAIQKLKFKHSSYSAKELMFDVALLGSGLGGIVLLEHLADIVRQSHRVSNEVTTKPEYWDALERAKKEIVATKGEHNYTRGEYGDIVAKYLSEFGISTGVQTQDVNNALIGTGNRLNMEDGPEEKKTSKRQHKLKM